MALREWEEGSGKIQSTGSILLELVKCHLRPAGPLHGSVTLMTRQLNEEQLRELNHLMEWCTAIVRFQLSLYAQDPLVSEWVSTKLEIVERTYLQRDLRGMRLVARDINESDTDEWPADRLTALNRSLREKFGKDLTDVKRRDLARIDRIRERGTIRTESEFRVVHGRAEEIWDNNDKKDEMEAINRLLADYESGNAGNT